MHLAVPFHQLFQQRDEVLATVVEPPFALLQEQVEVLAADAAVGVQPVLRVAPETIDAVDMVAAD